MTPGPERPTWQRLNAYVDGELAPAAAREVEQAAARIPGVAAALAELHQAKRATAGLLSAELSDLPPIAERPGAAPTERRRAGRRLWAAAAAILLLIGGLAYWRSGDSGDPAMLWLAQAEARYAAQVAAPLSSGAVLLPAALAGQAAAFDLSLAGLTLVQAGGANGAVYLGYQGNHGCRLGLWIAAAPAGLEAALQESLRDGRLVATWRHGEIGYAVLSQDMDPRRFTGIARLLAARTRAEHEMAVDAQALTLPCVG